MFPDNFLDHVRDKKYLYIPNFTKAKLSMGQVLKLALDHPKEYLVVDNERDAIQLVQLNSRGKQPRFSRKVVDTLAAKFHRNVCTSHIYIGIGDDNESYFSCHKDGMDVFFVQQSGLVTITLHDDKDGEPTDEYLMNPGDALWIPRGQYHWIHPLTERVSYSFGVERQPDPSTYC